jgi:hypothetical protein
MSDKLKVSFDFDSTLDIPSVQKFAKKLVRRGIEVWIVTSRVSERWGNPDWNKDLFKIAEDIGIKTNHIHFTEGGDKWNFIKRSGFLFHLDDCTDELKKIEDFTECHPVCHFRWGEKWGGREWKKRALSLLDKKK